MNWYLIEYSGVKSGKAIGTCTENLQSLLTQINPPKFLKLENRAYHSKLTGKFELFENWQSHYRNEIYINTDNIISFQPLRSDLLHNEIQGEFQAFNKDYFISVLISQTVLEESHDEIYSKWVPRINKKLENFHFKNVVIKGQKLLKPNEFIVTQMGTLLFRKEAENDLFGAIIENINRHFGQNNGGRLADGGEED